jgi:hypothetical protein
MMAKAMSLASELIIFYIGKTSKVAFAGIIVKLAGVTRVPP